MGTDMVLPVEDILGSPPSLGGRQEIGRSRDMRPVYGHVLGGGPTKISLIAGCHADEPVGPATLGALVGYLSDDGTATRWLSEITWVIVPHANPDGRYRNRPWTRPHPDLLDHRGDEDSGFDIGLYIDHADRELPGDDVEFGFPRDSSDGEARPENRAIAEFLADRGPFDLHGSLHGMALAPGPWFLIEESWSNRTRQMRDHLRQRVLDMGYTVFDPDRGGDKGFKRIDAGFTTRPDSEAMRRHFEQRDDAETAGKFRPSSMELVRRLGGDPFTFVSEMPIFLTATVRAAGSEAMQDLQQLRLRLGEGRRAGLSSRDLERREQVRPMPVRDQQRLQLHFLSAAIAAVVER